MARNKLYNEYFTSTKKTQNKTKLTRSEEHTSELQSQFRISYAVFCLKKKKKKFFFFFF